MNQRVLNITNGDAFNDYFLSCFGGEALPFRECMMDGSATEKMDSEAFFLLRSKEHHVSLSEYRSQMKVLSVLKENPPEVLFLWFGKDTFCQANLLALLSYLEEISFEGGIVLHYIDDETFSVLERDILVTLGEYGRIYRALFVEKKRPNFFGVLIENALDLYFDYHSEEGKFALIIKENFQMNETDLLCLLLEQSKDYGLSDVQIKKMIHRFRK